MFYDTLPERVAALEKSKKDYDAKLESVKSMLKIEVGILQDRIKTLKGRVESLEKKRLNFMGKPVK